MSDSRCQVKRCRSGEPVAVVYLKRGVCDRCWRKYMAEEQPEGALRRALGMLDTAPAPPLSEAEISELEAEHPDSGSGL